MNVGDDHDTTVSFRLVHATVETGLSGIGGAIVGLIAGIAGGTALALISLLIPSQWGSHEDRSIMATVWPIAMLGGVAILIAVTVTWSCLGAYDPSDGKLRWALFRVSFSGWFLGSLLIGSLISFVVSWWTDKWEYSALVRSHIPDRPYVLKCGLWGAGILSVAAGLAAFVGGACSCRPGRSVGGLIGGLFVGAMFGAASGVILGLSTESEMSALWVMAWPPGTAIGASAAAIMTVFTHKRMSDTSRKREASLTEPFAAADGGRDSGSS